jgi:hypothetical protein
VSFNSEGHFSLADGIMSAAAMRTVIRDITTTIDGTTDLDSGVISMTAKVVTAPTITSHLQGKDALAQIAIPISGTVLQPKMEVQNLKPDLTPSSLASLNDTYNQQITRMKAREAQRLMQKSQNEVEDILRPLRGPATLPIEQKK